MVVVVSIDMPPQQWPNFEAVIREIVNHDKGRLHVRDFVADDERNHVLQDFVIDSLTEVLRGLPVEKGIVDSFGGARHEDVIGVRDEALEDVLILEHILAMQVLLEVPIDVSWFDEVAIFTECGFGYIRKF
jgi:hypothetical protein